MSTQDLDPEEGDLLDWLGREKYSQYGECHGKTLDSLFAKGLAQLHQGREFQTGFIVQGDTKSYQAVSLTEQGIEARREWLKRKTDASPGPSAG